MFYAGEWLANALKHNIACELKLKGKYPPIIILKKSQKEHMLDVVSDELLYCREL